MMTDKSTLTVVDQGNTLLPMNLIEKAVTSGANLENIQKLMELQEQWERKQAKKSFYQALAKFQKECPTITKSKRGHNYMYAPLGDIITQIKDALYDNGLSFRFEQDHNDGIAITCIVSHSDGHTEKTTMTALADKTGSKNDVQAIGSTVTYLQRYTLIGALGITTADDDIDARLPTEFKKETKSDRKAFLIKNLELSAKKGSNSMEAEWIGMSLDDKVLVGKAEQTRIYKIAKAVDNAS